MTNGSFTRCAMTKALLLVVQPASPCTLFCASVIRHPFKISCWARNPVRYILAHSFGLKITLRQAMTNRISSPQCSQYRDVIQIAMLASWCYQGYCTGDVKRLVCVKISTRPLNVSTTRREEEYTGWVVAIRTV